MSMWVSKPGSDLSVSDPPVSRLEIRQMLANNVPEYFKDDFLLVDVTEEEQVTDTEQMEKAYGRRASIDSQGKVKMARRASKAADFADVLAMAEENYRAGRISLDDLLELRLGIKLDDRGNV